VFPSSSTDRRRTRRGLDPATGKVIAQILDLGKKLHKKIRPAYRGARLGKFAHYKRNAIP
jgi:hypothetical protein